MMKSCSLLHSNTGVLHPPGSLFRLRAAASFKKFAVTSLLHGDDTDDDSDSEEDDDSGNENDGDESAAEETGDSACDDDDASVALLTFPTVVVVWCTAYMASGRR